MNKDFNGYLFALFTVFLWSFNVIYSKILAPNFTPYEISFIRWIIPTFIFVPFHLRNIIKYQAELIASFNILLFSTLTGICALNVFIYYAGHTSSAVDMALIGSVGPIFLLIISAIFLHTKINIFHVVGIICALFGVVTVIVDGNFKSLANFPFTVGDVLMVFSALSFAIYALLQKQLPKEIPSEASLSVMIVMAALIFLPFAAYDYSIKEIHYITRREIFIFLALGVFNSGVAYLFWNKAISLIGSIKTGMVYYALPLFSAIEAYFILGEKIYLNQIYGAIFVIIGIAISSHQPKEKIKETYKQE